MLSLHRDNLAAECAVCLRRHPVVGAERVLDGERDNSTGRQIYPHLVVNTEVHYYGQLVGRS